MPRLEILLSSLGASIALLACSRPADDLREWRPSDHRHTTEATAESGASAPRVTGSAEAPLPGLEEVTIAAWQRQCTRCHGQLGRGDGPQAGLTKARDLSEPEWQASVTDERLAESIVKGRGLMPASALPPPTVQGLVRLVRLFNRDRMAQATGAPAAPASGATAAPAPSTPARPAASTRAVP